MCVNVIKGTLPLQNWMARQGWRHPDVIKGMRGKESPDGRQVGREADRNEQHRAPPTDHGGHAREGRLEHAHARAHAKLAPQGGHEPSQRLAGAFDTQHDLELSQLRCP